MTNKTRLSKKAKLKRNNHNKLVLDLVRDYRYRTNCFTVPMFDRITRGINRGYSYSS